MNLAHLAELLRTQADWMIYPALIVLPLGLTWSTRSRPGPGADPALSARLRFKLTLATGALLALWTAVFILERKTALSPLPLLFGAYPWMGMWIRLARPAIHAKDPRRGRALGWTDAPTPAFFAWSAPNTAPPKPLCWTHGIAATFVSAFAFYGIAIRGGFPFAEARFGRSEERLWLMMLIAFGVIALINVVVTSLVIMRQPAESAAYEARRRLKIQAIFWLLAVVVPGLAGAMMVAAAWSSGDRDAILRGGLTGGILLGLGGAVLTALRWCPRPKPSPVASERPG